MAAYRLTAKPSSVIRMIDNAIIPNDPKNHDWIEYTKWINAGNTPDPYVPPELSNDEIRDNTFKADAQVIDWRNRLAAMSPIEIDNWFTANVTNAASAIPVLKALVKILAFKLKG